MVALRLGMIGFSSENGHPFSFSAIINGYDSDAFPREEWGVILDYLERQPRERIGLDRAQVTHAWSQDPEGTRRLAAACRIPNVLDNVADMIGQVDGVVIARDDVDSHLELAQPFLEAGLTVFVDKPLTINPAELAYFVPYLRSGRLMSTSGFRFARELDDVKARIEQWDETRLVRAMVLNGWEKYGIHMLDAMLSLNVGRPLDVSFRRFDQYESYTVRLDSGAVFECDCLGAVGKTFVLHALGRQGHIAVDLHDNFSAFRRTMAAFIEQAVTGIPAVEPSSTLDSLGTIMAGIEARSSGKRIKIIDMLSLPERQPS